jgi:hypothetical protein
MQQLQADTRIEQPFERVGIGLQFEGQIRQRSGPRSQGVEDTEGHSREHRLRTAERDEQIENRRRVGRRQVNWHKLYFGFWISNLGIEIFKSQIVLP